MMMRTTVVRERMVGLWSLREMSGVKGGAEMTLEGIFHKR
jgi:hypothetical protein